MAREGARPRDELVRRHRGSIWQILVVQGILTCVGPAIPAFVGIAVGHPAAGLVLAASCMVALVVTAGRVSLEIGPDAIVVQNRFRRFVLPPGSSIELRSCRLSPNGLLVPHCVVRGRAVPVVAAFSVLGRRGHAALDDLMSACRIRT